MRKWKKGLLFIAGIVFLMASVVITSAEEETIAPVYLTAQIQQKVEELAQECISSGARTELEIALWMHDWLIEHADYDEDLSEYGADGVLLKGKGVCQSYTEAYHLLLDRMNIENYIISSPEMDHTWNVVKINGYWTNIDCTWDDPIGGGSENHEYFGLSDEDMVADHQWDDSEYPERSNIVWDDLDIKNATPYSLKTPTAGIDFTLIDSEGNILTRKNVKTGNTLLIFGEPSGGTMGFINAIAPKKEKLDKKGVHVIIVFWDKEQVSQYAKKMPFTCTYPADGWNEYHDFIGREGYVFEYNAPPTIVIPPPVIVLQNPQGYSYYHSSGFIYEPERVLATAMQKLPATREVASRPVYIYKNQKGLEKAVLSALKNRVTKLKLYNPKESLEEREDEILDKIEELLKWYSNKYGSRYGFQIRSTYCDISYALNIDLAYYENGLGHKHYWGKWETVSKATIKSPMKQEKTCLICGKTKRRNHGNKLKTKIKLRASSLSMQVRQSIESRLVTDMVKGDYVVSWKSSDMSILRVSGKPDGTCKLTAQKKTGRAEIEIKLYSGLKRTLEIKVQESSVKTKLIKGISGKMTLKNGEERILKPILDPITSQQKISFFSSNKKVASVNAKGVVTARKPGKVKITVRSGKKKVVCKVTVSNKK